MDQEERKIVNLFLRCAETKGIVTYINEKIVVIKFIKLFYVRMFLMSVGLVEGDYDKTNHNEITVFLRKDETSEEV